MEDYKVILKRARPHSVVQDADTGKLKIFASEMPAGKSEEVFDMVVLSVGQRPTQETGELAVTTDIKLNEFGFPASQTFVDNSKTGVFVAGAFSGFKDIAESVICSSSASCRALKPLNKLSGFIDVDTPEESRVYRDVSMESPAIALVICRCGVQGSGGLERGVEYEKMNQLIALAARRDPNVSQVVFAEKLCTRKGWEILLEKIKDKPVNRVLLASCLPLLFKRKLKKLSLDLGLNPCYLDAVDIYHDTSESAVSKVKMGLARIRYADAMKQSVRKVNQQVLVAGAGIAGMSAALAVADRGFKVVLVEKKAEPGGNLKWLKKNIKGDDFSSHVSGILTRASKHTHITMVKNAEIMDAWGEVGQFTTSLRHGDGSVDIVEHGAVIIATGASEAETQSYCFGKSDAIFTLKSLEKALDEKKVDPMALESVVMIQCVDSRDDVKPYCSRICCTSSLKHALAMKKINPDMNIYILYRDMMSFGFTEIYYKEAREAGIIFIQYDLEDKPDVSVVDDRVVVKIHEPVIDHYIEISPGLLVLATGLSPINEDSPASKYGAALDQYSFFKEADSKWRPVDSLKEGVFACGTALGPRDVEESIASAEAAAMRALRIITRKTLASASVTAGVKTSLCSLCERCIEVCPYGARSLNEEIMRIDVNPAMCQGCGSCAAICPNSASFINGFKDQQMFEMIDAAFAYVSDYTLHR